MSTLSNMPITASLARLTHEVTPARLSEKDKEKARLCWLDWVAVAIAATDDPAVVALRKMAKDEGGHPVASFLGTDQKGTVAQAALINGTASHVHDYDDTHQSIPGHPSVPVAAAVWPLAEREGATGEEAMAALAAGIEVIVRLGDAFGHAHYARGWHSSSTLGAIAAAAAAANLLRLSEEETITALGLAAARAAGGKATFGSHGKPLQLGYAGFLGLQSAEMARYGVSCTDNVIEAPGGFLDLHGDGYDPEPLLAPLEDPLKIHGVVFKHHAACFLTHATIDAATKLKQQIEIPDISHIVIDGDPQVEVVCGTTTPETGFEAKFSAPLAIALALTGRDTSALEIFAPETARDPALRDIAAKVSFETNPTIGQEDTNLKVRLTDGRELVIEGHAARPATDLAAERAQIEAKARSLCTPVLGDATDTVLNSVMTLGDAPMPNLSGVKQ